MSRNSTREYILRQQEDYLGELDRRKRGRILDETCRVTGLERKYVSKLLKGTRIYRPRKGRGKTYGPEAEKLLVQVWEASGCVCSKYLVTILDRILADLGELQNVVPAVAEQVRSMSASTMDRILKNRARTAKVWSPRNRHSGRNPLREAIPCESGERVPAREVPPGDIQVDSVAFCGGILDGDFFWAATATDRKTQWFEARPSYNLCAANYLPAFTGNLESFPFPIGSIHSDNGIEFMNHVIYAYETGKWPSVRLGRSWPGRKNHNAHIEQKNGSVLRTYMGDVRLSNPDLRRPLELLFEAICMYVNFFKPCVMLLSKTKNPNGKGFKCVYDKPRTPFERVLESGVLSPEKEAELRAVYKQTNCVHLVELIQKRYRHVLRLQRQFIGDATGCAGSLADWAHPPTPSGASSSEPAQPPNRSDVPSGTSLTTGVRSASVSVSSI